MANRPVLGRVWASTGDNFDPGDTKYRQGWLGEIPTYEVLNFIQNRTDLTLLAMAERGFSEWGGDIAYAQHAIVWDNLVGKVYLAKVANPDKTKAPSTNLAQWDLSAIQVTQQEVNDLHALLDSHIANLNNPHAVTALQAGTYDRATIQSKLILIQNNLDAHISRVDNPHGTTATQVGAVPVTGGTYTAPVTFNAPETKLNAAAGDHAVHADDVWVGIRANDIQFGIDIAGRRAFYDNGEKHLLLTEAEYLEYRKTYEHEYAVPTPDFEIDFLSDINIKQGFGESVFTRPSTKTYINKSGISVTAAVDEPRWENQGMLISSTESELCFASADQNLSGFADRTVLLEVSLPRDVDARIFDAQSSIDEFIIVKASDGAATLRVEDSAGVQHAVTFGFAPANKPVKFAYSWSAAGEVKAYMDGVLGGTLTIVPAPLATYEDMHFGTVGKTHMRKCQTWAQVLTDKQISTL